MMMLMMIMMIMLLVIMMIMIWWDGDNEKDELVSMLMMCKCSGNIKF